MNKIGGIVSGVSATLSSTSPGVTITQPFSTYPNLPASGMRTNNTPFQISTSPSLVCGTNIDLVLTVHTATNGTFSIPIRMFTGAAGSPSRFNRTGDQAIPDGGTLDSTIVVAGITRPTHHVVISLHLSHTVDQDLDISIEDPDGTTVLLSTDNGGTLDDYGTSCADADRTTFTDAASLPITSGSAPFRGSFRPEQPLSVFRGKFGADVNGTWHLNITDDTAGGLGTLHCWSISVFPTACSPGGGECDPPCPGCPVHLDIAHDPSNDSRVILKWTTSAVGFDLVATNSLQAPPNAFAPIGPPPVVVNSKFTVTNNASGSARFYQLRKP
jgi:subtilisin-like proprotein convertase family protein